MIATVSSVAKENHARNGRADFVVNYRTQDVKEAVLAATKGNGVDRIAEAHRLVESGEKIGTVIVQISL